jgi:hypothetical protein
MIDQAVQRLMNDQSSKAQSSYSHPPSTPDPAVRERGRIGVAGSVIPKFSSIVASGTGVALPLFHDKT